MNTFDNKLVLITGGSSGIGLSLACKLASLDANIWILARRVEQLQHAKNLIEALRVSELQTIGTIAADVSDRGQVTTALKKFVFEVGVPDLLVNSAGVVHPGLFQDLPLDVFEWMINVNYLGTVYVTRSLVPGMIHRRSGYIVNVSSVAGYLGVYGYAAYSPSKYAVRGFSDVLRSELKPHGIQVSVVFPPDTATPQLQYELAHRPEVTNELNSTVAVISPDRVADAIIKGVQRNRYTIFPNFDSAFTYHLNNLLGNLTYPLMDYLVAKALRKHQ
ncbi:MAG: SDR family oxidoreductase [Anaerolineaceae bacterium]|nr:SDR family oxidoreductase [Anaerolineaceae bacterium]